MTGVEEGGVEDGVDDSKGMLYSRGGLLVTGGPEQSDVRTQQEFRIRLRVEEV